MLNSANDSSNLKKLITAKNFAIALILLFAATCSFAASGCSRFPGLPQRSAKHLWRLSSSLNEPLFCLGTNGVLYVECSDTNDGSSTLAALNAKGVKKWAFRASGAMHQPAVDASGSVYFGVDFAKPSVVDAPGGRRETQPAKNGARETLLAVNKDGSKKFEFETSGSVLAAPAIASDGTIFFGTASEHGKGGSFYALTPEGHKKWEIATTGSVTKVLGIGSDVMFSTDDGWIYRLNGQGQKVWAYKAGNIPVLFFAVNKSGSIYLMTGDAKIHAVTPFGKKKWEYSINNRSPYLPAPAVADDGTMYVVGEGGTLYAVGSDGKQRWQFESNGETGSPPVIGANNVVYYVVSVSDDTSVDYGSRLFAVNPDGSGKWSYKIQGIGATDPGQSTPIMGPGNVLFFADKADLMAIKI